MSAKRIIDQARGNSFLKERALGFQKESHIPAMLLAVALDFVVDRANRAEQRLLVIWR
jgi:hypothetical protein